MHSRGDKSGDARIDIAHGRSSTGPRTNARRDPWLLVAVVAATVGLAWLGMGLLALPGSDAWGFDYRAYHAAAARLVDGLDLYVAATLSGPFQPIAANLYLYPPPFAVGVIPLTMLPAELATSTWYVLHVAALAAACALMPVRPRLRIAAFAVGALSFAVLRDMALGNVSVLLLPALAAAWRWLDTPRGSVALALAIVVRPTLALFLGWFILRRRWRAVLWTGVTGLLVVIVSIPIVGVEAYPDYLTMMRNLSGLTGAPNSLDLGSMALLLGLPTPLATASWVLGVAAAALAMLLSLRRDPELGFMVTVIASLLVPPLLWDHYLVALLLPAVFLASRGHPWAMLLPLFSWLPPQVHALGILAMLALVFLARDSEQGPLADAARETDDRREALLPRGPATV